MGLTEEGTVGLIIIMKLMTDDNHDEFNDYYNVDKGDVNLDYFCHFYGKNSNVAVSFSFSSNRSSLWNPAPL